MLSPGTVQLLDRLFAAQTAYRPNAEIAVQLADKRVLMFVSPTCAGKNTIMEATAKLDNRFKVIGTFTTREPRTSDLAYTYYENTDEGLQPLVQAIEKRRVVQYAVNTYAHTIYGSNIGGYTGEYNLKDVYSSAIDQFCQLGFRKAITISVTAVEPDIWLKRFEERFPIGHPQRQARRDEGIESIEWSQAQKSVDHHWVGNTDGEPETAAYKVIAIATGKSNGDNDARAVAEECLQLARRIKI